MTKKTTKLLTACKLILKDLNKDWISKEHRHAEIEINCPECRARMLEGFLNWYEEILKFRD